jgi:hypothetical protein
MKTKHEKIVKILINDPSVYELKGVALISKNYEKERKRLISKLATKILEQLEPENTLNRDKVMEIFTAREILLNQRNGDDKPITAALHPEGWVFKMILRAMEEYAQQNTLNRDKVMEIIDEYRLKYCRYLNGIGDFPDIWEYTDALCSLSLPTLSEGEIKKAWANNRNTTTPLSPYSGTMTYNLFFRAVKELTKPKKGGEV